jgi:hypothetical protein
MYTDFGRAKANDIQYRWVTNTSVNVNGRACKTVNPGSIPGVASISQIKALCRFPDVD